MTLFPCPEDVTLADQACSSIKFDLTGSPHPESSGGGGRGGSSLTGKQRMLIKLGKHAKSSNKSAMMAAAAMKRARRK